MDVVTGAFSFTGRAIAEELLARGRVVRTLSRRPADVDDPLGARVEWASLEFSDPVALRDRLRGAEVLYTTYWVRFERGGTTFARAVDNTSLLVDAARDAGVRRVVHVSVARCSAATSWLDGCGATLGTRYASEPARNFRSYEPL